MSLPFTSTDFISPRGLWVAGALAVALLIALWVQSAHADDIFDRLMSPGALSRAHERLEQNCKNCHKPLDKKAQTQLCRSCHKPLDKQILTLTGYHGRDLRARTGACRLCHTEHKGPKAAITIFDRDVFNHDLTDYPLKGAHKRLTCNVCHAAGAKFSAAPATCVACHKADDTHRGRLGTNCASCHNEQGWKGAKFDHNTTRFALSGKHATATCDSCHPDQRYQKTPTDCFACHQLDDKHNGANGRNCAACHSPQRWAAVSFDHAKQTRFPLTGAHAAVGCKTCHGAGEPKKLLMTCISCHRKDDTHKGSNGTACEACHTTANWKKAAFDHDTRTQFPLRGAHKTATCRSCHTGGVFTKKIDKACFSCHRDDDVHKGQEGTACQNCHNETAWGGKVKFDHGLTRFPLVGLHASTTCELCHLTAAYKDAPKACVDCHAKDDSHKGTLGPDCAACHNPNGWRFWTFDHDKQTDFALTGRHEGLACIACHTKPSKSNAIAGRTCIACHRSDDIHRGEFGERCDACHSTEAFAKLHNTR